MQSAQASFPARARVVRDAVAAASVAGHDAETFLRRVADAVSRAVPHEGGGWATMDPGTVLWTGGVMYGFPVEVGMRFYDNELLDTDVLKFSQLAQRAKPIGTLSRATGGRLDDSPRYRKMYAPFGMTDEMRVAFVIDGACFGTVCLVRREGGFNSRETALMESISRNVAYGLRAAFARPRGGLELPTPGGVAGVLVVDDELRLVSATDAANGWIDELGRIGEGLLPSSVCAVVRRARAMADGGDADGPPRARVCTRSGVWLSVHASALAPAPRTWAVVIEPARPAEVLPLVAQAHELTAREHEVFGMLLRGVPDKTIAGALVISDHTAREHVRKVQQKLGVRSRAELQALMHDGHYTPWVATLD